jgi:hypothetical protein
LRCDTSQLKYEQALRDLPKTLNNPLVDLIRDSMRTSKRRPELHRSALKLAALIEKADRVDS